MGINVLKYGFIHFFIGAFMKTLAFNTGRTYSLKGQRIAAALLDNADILFVDIDRHLYGTIRANGLSIEDVMELGFFTRHEIMKSYDENNYSCAYDLEDEYKLLQQLRNIAESI
jgi:hypothetical protein